MQMLTVITQLPRYCPFAAFVRNNPVFMVESALPTGVLNRFKYQQFSRNPAERNIRTIVVRIIRCSRYKTVAEKLCRPGLDATVVKKDSWSFSRGTTSEESSGILTMNLNVPTETSGMKEKGRERAYKRCHVSPLNLATID